MSLELSASFAPKLGFVAHQNAVPLLHSLSLRNPSSEALHNLELTLSASPAFLQEKRWTIPVLEPGELLEIEDRKLRVDADLLATLTESLSGELRLELRRPDAPESLLAERVHPVEVLAHNQWGGAGSMPELLPAFCMPNDPAVDRILHRASEVLTKAGRKGGIDGYTGNSRTRTWELASAIWSAVAGLGLRYALPPASFEQEGQKIRTPSALLAGGLATCLDSTLLFASLFEQANLNPVLILAKQHALVGVWLQPQEFAQLATEEALALRKRVELDELLVFETTLATHSPAPAFSTAVEEAKKQLEDDRFVMAIDIRRARMRRIKPLATALGEGTPAEAADTTVPGEVFEPGPALPGFDVVVETEPQTPHDRVLHWQRKLLDLTARNRLLNLPERSKHVPLLCPDPARLEDLLAEGKSVSIRPLPNLEAGGRDIALYEQQNREQLLHHLAAEALESKEVLSPVNASKLESDLIDLYRKANTDMEEGGANTLFLALGFLKWKKAAEDPRSNRAPLILLPVTLKRSTARSGVKMSAHEDEPRFNMTLLELLRQDFQVELPGLEGELPVDGSGIDVTQVWNIVRQAVKDLSGFEVLADTALGTFSFSKYLMWKDLSERSEQLMRNKVVRHLIEGGTEGFAGEPEYPKPEQLDQEVQLRALYAPLPADSSQLAAVVASGRGCNFVLDGPPGTGKSQTIANMIAHNLALGRRVLFVAEKMAALSVVYRRLQEKGLGEFCLEVHSHKANKMDILRQLDRAWELRAELSEEAWAAETQRLQTLRDQLNQLSELLHRNHSNGWSLHQAIGLVLRDEALNAPRLNWGEAEHSVELFEQMRAAVNALSHQANTQRQAPAGFSLLKQGEWSNAWQDAIVDAAARCAQSLGRLCLAAEVFSSNCALPAPAHNLSVFTQLTQLGADLLRCHGRDLGFAFSPKLPALGVALETFTVKLEAYRAVEGSLSVRYAPEAVRRIDAAAFTRQWKEAEASFFLLAFFARKRVTKDLAAVGNTSGLPAVAADLPKLERLSGLLGELDALRPELEALPHFKFLASDLDALHSELKLASSLQRNLAALAAEPEGLRALQAALKALILETNALLAPEGKIAASHQELQAAQEAFSSDFKAFSALAMLQENPPLAPDALRSCCEAVQAHPRQLKSWCAWQRLRGELVRLGLTPLLEAFEAGKLGGEQADPAFHVAYAQWFASTRIDREPRLRDFSAEGQMQTITQFQQLANRVSELSVQLTRARLASQLPSKEEVGKKDGFGILKHELQKKRRHKPLRQLAREMGDAFGRLAPCMLMSPLSIAQYLPPDQDWFDLVIFDEASQITPWDAVGSIARGSQVVIAGDPRQMPPTNFFQRGTADSEFDGNLEEDLESILDECLGVGIPQHSLSWHYRSRHESLITFSNRCYYGGKLVTFPAAQTRESAVAWRRVDAVYAKGKARTNPEEAAAIVQEVVTRLKDPAFLASGHSIGIITLNADQQKLIEDLLDTARKEQPEIEVHFGDAVAEPLFVKNLETVQGDERDVILLGIGYGPTERGAARMSMNFGPLNRDGGERRLNVALTRARREMLVFSSFDPSMIDLNRTSARAVCDLKQFLEFAARGTPGSPAVAKHTASEEADAFVEVVARGLRAKGWNLVPRVGVSKFRIDLGIVHPTSPDCYLAGIECDGAVYRQASTARDRDKVRSAVLEGLGWTLLRAWSAEWFVDPESQLEKLDASLRALLEEES